ncbi:MAG: hypothetical protein NVSMB47_08930 [Polyangiales bacterium]
MAMHNLKTLAAFGVAVGALLVAGKAGATGSGVAFVHGTGDYSTSAAVSNYWTQSSIDTMRGGRKYVVVGYSGASQDAMTSYSSVANQISSWGSSAGITYGSASNDGLVVVTHSNGSNPVRYIYAHSSASSATYNVWYWTRKAIFVAGDDKGTPLADKVTSAGTLASIGNSITSFFGSNSSNPAVWQQRTDRMSTYNSNGTFGSTPANSGGGSVTSLNGNPIDTVVGTDVYAAVWSGDAYCGGYWMTAGLKAAKIYGFGYSACADGFIGCDSANYVGSNVVWDGRINHNQSRRSCHGSGSAIGNDINGVIGNYAIPSDYTIAPAAQACNATTQGWTGSGTTSTYWYGCTSSMQTDANTDHDCFVSYGGDNGWVAPADVAQTAYNNSSYYANLGVSGCQDSWLGDGHCDLCLIAKYGYDSASGSTSDGDCVNQGSGTSNSCYDVAYNGYASQIQYLQYTATH